MIERLGETLSDLNEADIDRALHGDVHLRAGGLEVTRQSRQTV